MFVLIVPIYKYKIFKLIKYKNNRNGCSTKIPKTNPNKRLHPPKSILSLKPTKHPIMAITTNTILYKHIIILTNIQINH